MYYSTTYFFIRKSLKSGNVPDCLKQARVIPLHKTKTGRHDLVNNYRPISLLSVFSTILEKVVYMHIKPYIADDSLIECNQFGFQLDQSCTHACLFHLSTVYSLLDKGMKVGCLYIDIRNAFSSFDYSLPLKKFTIVETYVFQMNGLHHT